MVIALVVLVCGGCGPAPNNRARLPFGALDAPGENTVVKGVAFAFGWALSEDGVDGVEIYLDRSFLQNAVVKGRREDVARVFPQFAKVQNFAWVTELHTESLPIGRHEISARVISGKKATRDLIPRMVIIEH